MMQSVAIALLFIFALFTEASLIASLGKPFNAIPFLFLVGIVVMHRLQPGYGIAWFILSAIFLPTLSQDKGIWLAYVAVAIAGSLLMDRVFTNRSIYALLGLGATLYVLFALIQLFFKTEAYQLFYGFIFAMIGIYTGSAIARFSERYTKQLFIIRQ